MRPLIAILFLLEGCGASAVPLVNQVRASGGQPVGLKVCGVGTNDSDIVLSPYSNEKNLISFCVVVQNATNGTVSFDRRAVRLVGKGITLEPDPNGISRLEEIEPQTDVTCHLRFVSEELNKGEELKLELGSALRFGGVVLNMPPLRYRVK